MQKKMLLLAAAAAAILSMGSVPSFGAISDIYGKQRMPAAEQGDENLLEHGILAEDHFGHLGFDRRQHSGRMIQVIG